MLLDCGIQFFYCVFRIVPSIKTIAGLVFGIPYFDLHAVGVDLFLYDFTIVGVQSLTKKSREQTKHCRTFTSEERSALQQIVALTLHSGGVQVYIVNGTCFCICVHFGNIRLVIEQPGQGFNVYVSDTDATSFMGFYNINRTATANANDGTTAKSTKSDEEIQKTRTGRTDLRILLSP